MTDDQDYVMLQSYLNMFQVLQMTTQAAGDERLKFRIKVKALVDEDVVQKVREAEQLLIKTTLRDEMRRVLKLYL